MSEESSSDEDCYGPALPPHLQNQPKVIGPQLPASFLKSINDEGKSKSVGGSHRSSDPEFQNTSNGKEIVVEKDEEDDNDIGPYPPEDPRSHRLPKAQLNKEFPNSAPKREEWMLICPKNKSIAEVIGQVGITQRKFLGRTPDEVKPPEEDETEPDFHEIAKAELEENREKERDERMNEMLKKSGSKEKESLLSIHRKRKRVVDETPTERRPFNRDEDLKVGGLSKEDQEKFIKKTSELGSRFKGGKQKFL